MAQIHYAPNKICNWCKNWQGTCFLEPDGSYSCPKCHKDLALRREVDANPENFGLEAEIQTINPDLVMKVGEDVLNAINTDTDIFNSPTVELENVRQSIESNDSIQNKAFEYAKYVKEHFTKLKQVIHVKNLEVKRLTGEINNLNRDHIDIQSHLNRLANQLTNEEREQLQLKDVSYSPTKVKNIVPKPPKPKKVKYTQTEIQNAAKRASDALGTNVKTFTIETFCVQRNCSPDTVADWMISTVKIGKQKAEHERIDAEEKDVKS